MGNGISTYNNDGDNEQDESDREVVLNRLLTMQSDEDVDQWRSLRVGLSVLHVNTSLVARMKNQPQNRIYFQPIYVH